MRIERRFSGPAAVMAIPVPMSTEPSPRSTVAATAQPAVARTPRHLAEPGPAAARVPAIETRSPPADWSCRLRWRPSAPPCGIRSRPTGLRNCDIRSVSAAKPRRGGQRRHTVGCRGVWVNHVPQERYSPPPRAYARPALREEASAAIFGVPVNKSKGGDPVSHCPTPRRADVTWMLASGEVKASWT